MGVHPQRPQLQRPHVAPRHSRPLRCPVSAVASKQVIDSEGKKVEKKLQEKHAPAETPVPAQMGNGSQRKTVLDSTDLEGDAVLEKELSDNGEHAPSVPISPARMTRAAANMSS